MAEDIDRCSLNQLGYLSQLYVPNERKSNSNQCPMSKNCLALIELPKHRNI